MVVPIGNIANKLNFSPTFSSLTTTNSQDFVLSTVFPSNYMGIDTPARFVPVHDFEVRRKTLSTKKNFSRDLSMSSTQSSIIYHKRMANNSMDIDQEPVDNSSALFYKEEYEKIFCLSKVTKTLDNTRPLDGNNETNNTNPQHACNINQNKQFQHDAALNNNDDNIINIQLPYDLNILTKPELWSSNFHLILLHGSVEQIASDTKSIKDSLNFMARYINNKKVNPSKTNDLSDFNGIGDFIWNFISAVYQANWDVFYTDNKSNTLRAKIASKFMPRMAPNNNKSNKKITKTIPVTIDKIPLPPLLPVKSKREVNVISKYFQNKKPLVESKNSTMSYTQATKPSANTSEVLKIKEAFLALNAKKIDQINNIVKENSKPKPQIQMTTKGPSRKQVIVLMSTENNNNFMKNSALHISSINKQLQNAKSEVLVDYIQSNTLGIMVITNKMSQQSDLLIIEQYVKNSNDINTLQVEEPHLPKSKSYLKIIGISYYPHGNSQDCLNSSDIETILKQNQILDNVNLASRLRVIKVSPKSDMSIVWIDIWDVQSGSKAKMLINKCFNVGRYIATI